MTYYESKQIEDGNSTGKYEIVEINTFHAGGKTVTVKDDFLTTAAACHERADAEFLEKSYSHDIVHIETYYREGVEIGDIVSHDAKRYKIVNIDIQIQGAKVQMKITGKRWR